MHDLAIEVVPSGTCIPVSDDGRLLAVSDGIVVTNADRGQAWMTQRDYDALKHLLPDPGTDAAGFEALS